MARRRYRLAVITTALVVFFFYPSFHPHSPSHDDAPAYRDQGQYQHQHYSPEGIDDAAYDGAAHDAGVPVVAHQTPEPLLRRPVEQSQDRWTNTDTRAEQTDNNNDDDDAAAADTPTPARPQRQRERQRVAPAGNPAINAPPGGGGRPKEGYQPVSVNPPPAPAVHWERTPEYYPVATDDLIPLPSGDPVAIPRIQSDFGPESPSERATREHRLNAVKAEMQHAWSGYRAHGWMHDEIRPATGETRDPFCGWSATLVDALDTLWIMGMYDEFDDAARAVADIDFTTTPLDSIPVFETVIRYLGGLIAAYDVSGARGSRYPLLLAKAVELAEVLFGVFDTPNRLPVLYYRWKPHVLRSGPRRAGFASVAELGSMTMELTRLAQLTGEAKYYDAAARITNAFEDLQDGGTSKIPGLFPEYLDASGCNTTALNLREAAERATTEVTRPAAGSEMLESGHLHKREPLPPPLARPPPNPAGAGARASSTLPDCIPQGLAPSTYGLQSFSMGAAQDSTYEYFPKQYLLLGGLEPKYKKLHLRTVGAVKNNLLFRPMIPDASRDLRFSAKIEIGRDNAAPRIRYEAHHLTCFLGGMFGLGGRIFGQPEDVEVGKKLADGCVWAYESMKSGIMPEGAQLVSCPRGSMLPGGQCVWNETEWHHAIDPQWQAREASAVQWELRRKQVAHEVAYEVAGRAPAGAGGHDPSSDKSRNANLAPPHTNRQAGSLKRDAPAPLVLQKPMSHAEFVANKLKAGALPPGYASTEPRAYILRPEAVESVWYMYRITGDPSWMDKGWSMFEAVIAATKTKYGHSAIDDVTMETPRQSNSMESFWMAETLKYFYLLFSQPDTISLDEWVLNTEAVKLLDCPIDNRPTTWAG